MQANLWAKVQLFPFFLRPLRQQSEQADQALIEVALRGLSPKKAQKPNLECLYAGALLLLKNATSLAHENKARALLALAAQGSHPLALGLQALMAFYGLGEAQSFERAQLLLEQGLWAANETQVAELWYHLYLIYEQKYPRSKQTALALERALALNPNETTWAPLWAALAEHSNSAIEKNWQRYCYTKVVHLSADKDLQARAYFKLGQSYEETKSLDKAFSAYQACVSLAPGLKTYAPAWLFLARHYAQFKPIAIDLVKDAPLKVSGFCADEPQNLAHWQALENFYQKDPSLPKNNWIVRQCQAKIASLSGSAGPKPSVRRRLSSP